MSNKESAKRAPTDLFALGLRMEKSLQVRLKQAAEHNRRSLNAEIISRLEKSVDSETAHATDFNRIHAKSAWLSLSESVRHEFLAINYLSAEAWAESGGDSNCLTIGARMKNHKGLAKRIFILDDLEGEKERWTRVWEIHHHPAAPVEAKFILKTNFETLRQQFVDADVLRHADMISTLGFVVLDRENLAEWYYDRDRRAERVHVSALDTDKASQFKDLFLWIWDSSFCQLC